MTIISELRTFRILGGIAVFDLVVSTVFMAWIVKRWSKKRHLRIDSYEPLDNLQSLFLGFILAIALGITAHKIFGVDTQLNYMLGLSNKPQTSYDNAFILEKNANACP